MIKGKTSSGFAYKISEARVSNYELIESLNETETNPLALPKTVNLLLGKEQADKLKDHLRDEEGLISTENLSSEIMEIFQNQSETKN